MRGECDEGSVETPGAEPGKCAVPVGARLEKGNCVDKHRTGWGSAMRCIERGRRAIEERCGGAV